MKGIIKVSAIILGSIIGAGFASGQEIKIFFTSYGTSGLLGLLIAVTIIVIIINLVLRISFKKNIENYISFLEKICCNNKVLSDTMKNIVNIFLLSSFFIMGIGFATCLEEQFYIPKCVGGVIISILCYATFMGNINRIIKVNTYIMPVLLGLIIFAGIKIGFPKIQFVTNAKIILNSVIYASYNLLPLIPILLTVRKEIDSVKNINLISIVAWFGISLSAASIFAITCCDIGDSEMILIEATKEWNFGGGLVFPLAILAAIYTSAVCSGYGFIQNCVKSEKQYSVYVCIICIAMIFISNFSFSTAIEKVYPLFGFLGIIQILLLFKNGK